MKKHSKGISLNYLSKHYDRITPAEKSKFRQKQIGLIHLKPGERVLEVGCATGILSILAKRAVGDTGVVEGVDIAPKMIAVAQEKATKAHLRIGFQVASIDSLPYLDGYFDVVISSLMFHHLTIDIKKKGSAEIHRVLKQDGRFFLSDFCSSHWLTMPVMYLRHIWMPSTRYQLFGKLHALIKETGFNKVKLVKKGFFLESYMVTK